jgi:hypothetical protein
MQPALTMKILLMAMPSPFTLMPPLCRAAAPAPLLKYAVDAAQRSHALQTMLTRHARCRRRDTLLDTRASCRSSTRHAACHADDTTRSDDAPADNVVAARASFDDEDVQDAVTSLSPRAATCSFIFAAFTLPHYGLSLSS